MPPPMIVHKVNEQYRVPRPKNIKEVPKFVFNVIKNFFSRLTYIFRLVWDAKPSVLFVTLFMSVFNGVMPLIGALIGKELLNILAMAFNREITDFSVIVWLLVAQFGYMLINSLAASVYSMIIRIAGELVSNHIKIMIMDKAKTVDLRSFDLPDFYAKLENANREAGNRPIQIIRATFEVLSTVISMLSFIIVLFGVSPAAPFIIILFAMPSAIINFVFRRKNVNYMWRRSKDRRKMDYYSDTIVNKDVVKEMKLFGLSDSFIDRYKSVFKNYFAGIKKLITQECAWNSGATTVTTIVNCLLFIYIALGVFKRKFQVGDYSLYTGALNSISNGVSDLISTTATIYEGTLFINNLISFMEEELTVVPLLEKPRHIKRHTGHTIKFNDVCFAYPGTDKLVLDHLNLEIDAGDTVVIVGLNGAGKTTLIKLLTRLYDPTYGTITLDGEDIRNYDTAELYDMFGIIFQDFGKYAVSVGENIHFGEVSRDYDESDIENAARMGDADKFINRLPDKYNTQLMRWFDDDATDLSIGQWQKLSVARAFYSDSDILILDEPTASLDPIAEQEIFNRFDELRKDKTTIFVSHRLSSATVANKIVVLGDGKVLETGTHAELMAAHGRYYKLFSTQAKRYVSNSDGKEQINIGDIPHDSDDFPRQGDIPHDMPHGGFLPAPHDMPPMPPMLPMR